MRSSFYTCPPTKSSPWLKERNTTNISCFGVKERYFEELEALIPYFPPVSQSRACLTWALNFSMQLCKFGRDAYVFALSFLLLIVDHPYSSEVCSNFDLAEKS